MEYLAPMLQNCKLFTKAGQLRGDDVRMPPGMILHDEL